MTILFAGPVQTVMLILRIIASSLMFSIFITSTNPTDLTKFLEKCHIPIKLAIIPSLSLSLIPRTLQDIQDTYNTLFLRGEIEGSFIKWLPKLLTITISSALYRSSFIESSLYIRGFANNKRKKLGPNHNIRLLDFVKLLFWMIIFLMIVLGSINGLF
jgi:energy-coupling factor transporter transmembrane protein EcfT